MALKQLKKTPIKKPVQIESKVKKFIAKGGILAESFDENVDDHRLTLRIPQWLMQKVDEKRKKRVGKISRNLWILEVIQKATQK